MEIEKIIKDLLDNPSMPVAPEWADEMMERYPAFTLPVALLLKRGDMSDDPERRRRLRMFLMLNSPDREALADMVDLSGEDWAGIYPPSFGVATPTTESAIDVFLNTYGSTSDKETELLENLIFNPVPADYFGDEDAPADPDAPLLPPELAHSENPEPQSEPEPTPNPVLHPAQTRPSDQEPAKATDDSLLSESLAKIFIKQRRYSRAYEIISNLSLKFPEKSVYFADQLRFLQKLIKNQQLLQK